MIQLKLRKVLVREGANLICWYRVVVDVLLVCYDGDCGYYGLVAKCRYAD